MKKMLYLFAALLLVSTHACEKKNNSGIYDNCCGTAPLADEVTLLAPADSNTTVGRVYIPNIFVPNASPGAFPDDFFIIFGNDGILQIESFRVISENGEMMHDANNFLPNDPVYAWIGKKSDGSFYYGSFKYEVKVEFIDGQKKTYIGKACAFECGAGDFPAQNLPDCLFPGQNDGTGSFDQNLPYPVDCF